MTWEVEINHKNIISKSLFKELDVYIRQRLDRGCYVQSNNEHIQFNIYRLTFELLETFQKEGKIEIFKVICDKRNNNQETKNKGIFFTISISYRQSSCLKSTTLEYRLI